MDLKTYLKTFETEAALELFAKRCECSPGHLWNCAYKTRKPNPELAVLIEKHSKGEVRRQDLFPAKFRAIWPELKAA